MFAQVKLLNGFARPLWYKIPDEKNQNSIVGSIVLVPLKNQLIPGIVVSLYAYLADQSFAIREISSFQAFPGDAHYYSFIKQLSSYYQTDSMHFLKRIAQFITLKEKSDEEKIFHHIEPEKSNPQVILTQEQKIVVDFMTTALENPSYNPVLLHGVTGSGKTEVYKEIIIKTLGQRKSCILLLPEISLATQFEKILKSQLPSHIPLYSFHSGTSLKNKRLLWDQLLAQCPVLIIGVHVPILLPILNLGSIIIDEEHEIGYQEKKHPKVNTKEAALLRAKISNIPILLGSATPCLASLHQVKTKKWHFFQLTKRFAGNFPVIKTVILPQQKDRKNFWISTDLLHAIKDRLAKKEQIIIFINRRGYSFFVQCKKCTFIFTCISCSVSLTLHENDQMHCHYCGYSLHMPTSCPSCKSSADQFLKKGIGTQQVVSILEKLFPDARIARADLDVSTHKKVWQQTLAQFEQGAIDILVGTQTITKGYHFPKVTLVGILWADLNLHFPIYNAGETTLQQLIQVAGRAGRASDTSLVIVQTMIDHPIFNFINEIDYLKFYELEQEIRKQVNYPPYTRFIEIELKYTDEKVIDEEALLLTEKLISFCAASSLPITVLGPAKPAIGKIKNVLTRKIYLKASDINQAIALFKSIDHNHYQSRIYFTPNPSN